MAFKADQPRIPKGFVGAGRFMKVGQVLTALKDVSHPGDSGRRGVREPRLAKAGSKLSRRDEAVERTFAGAARASKAPAAPKAPRAKKADAPDARQAAIKGTVRDSVARHATASGWADIADIRDDLDAAGYTRAEQDTALKAMLADEPHFRAVPLADARNLRQRDRDAALVLGVDYNVAIRTTPGKGERAPGEATDTPEQLRADLAAREKRLADDAAAGLPEKALQDQREGIERLRKQLADLGGPAKPKKRFEDMTEDELRAAAEERRARQAAVRKASIAETGHTPAQREILADLEGRRADAEAEGRKVPRTRAERQAQDAALRNEVFDSLHRKRRTDLPRSTDPNLTPAQREILQNLEARRAEADAEGTAKSKPKRGSLANAGAKLAQTKTATSSHLAALRAAETRADAEAALAGLRGADLKQIARELSVDPNRPVAELRQAIIERTVGARINSRAVRGL